MLSSVASASEEALSSSSATWIDVQDSLAKHEFALFRSCIYWQRLHRSHALSEDNLTLEALAMLEVVASQLLTYVNSFATALVRMVPALQQQSSSVYWRPGCAYFCLSMRALSSAVLSAITQVEFSVCIPNNT